MMREVENKAVLGNAEVVEGLERLLARARKGAMRAAAVICCEFQGSDATFLGDQSARPHIFFGCNVMSRVLLDSVVSAEKLPDAPPADFVRYDLNMDPVCFDFIPWLVSREMTRRREGAPAPLKVAFTANPNAITESAVTRALFVQNVLRPALALFGAVETKDATGRREDHVGLRDIAHAFRAGEEVPQVEVPALHAERMRIALAGSRPVTLTLREAAYGTHRNSNLLEWLKLARWLRDRGEEVVIVRDAAMAHDDQFYEFEAWPAASRDLHWRAALYAQSKCCLFVQNGPFGLACFSKVPWLMFAWVGDDQPDQFNQPEQWRLFMGTDVGGQIPWATDKQRMIYQPDTFENMRQAYEELAL
jgi:hypothetical protein